MPRAARWTHHYLRCSAPGRCPLSLRRSRASRRCARSRRSRACTGCAARRVSTRRESSCCPSCGATATPTRRRSCCRRTAGSSTARSVPGRPGRPVSRSSGRSTPWGQRRERLASWDEAPLGLAQDSESASVAAAELVDVGAGTAESDYAGKEVAGRIVLTSSQPGAVAALAVGKLGAAGIVSWAQNQHQGWWGEDETLVRWGHLDTFAKAKTFAFMVSPARARKLRDRLAARETIRLSAVVDAGAEAGAYSIPTAVLPGTDPALGSEAIVFSCHLDHPRPGANDNASGCAAILEVARTLSKLVQEGRLPSPRRSLRFVWPPEIEGTHALLAGRPELAEAMKAAIHLDMVGGGPETRAVFHVTRGPASLPSFVHDLVAAQAAWVNEQTMAYAATGIAAFPLVAAARRQGAAARRDGGVLAGQRPRGLQRLVVRYSDDLLQRLAGSLHSYRSGRRRRTSIRPSSSAPPSSPRRPGGRSPTSRMPMPPSSGRSSRPRRCGGRRPPSSASTASTARRARISAASRRARNASSSTRYAVS